MSFIKSEDALKIYATFSLCKYHKDVRLLRVPHATQKSLHLGDDPPGNKCDVESCGEQVAYFLETWLDSYFPPPPKESK